MFHFNQMHSDFLYFASFFFFGRKERKRKGVKSTREKITGRQKIKQQNKHRLNIGVTKSQTKPFHEPGGSPLSGSPPGFGLLSLPGTVQCHGVCWRGFSSLFTLSLSILHFAFNFSTVTFPWRFSSSVLVSQAQRAFCLPPSET